MNGYWLEPFSKRRFHCEQFVEPALAPAPPNSFKLSEWFSAKDSESAHRVIFKRQQISG
jgi:hypothetical protein